MRKPRLALGFFALLIGCLVNYIGDRIIGVRIELWWGLQTFYDPLWFLQLFIWPVVVGFVVAAIFGIGGKWLCYFPPMIVRSIAYFEMVYLRDIPDGAALIPFGWWLFYVILAVECAAIGGVFGEAMIKRVYGRTSEEEAEKIYLKPNKNNKEGSPSE